MCTKHLSGDCDRLWQYCPKAQPSIRVSLIDSRPSWSPRIFLVKISQRREQWYVKKYEKFLLWYWWLYQQPIKSLQRSCRYPDLHLGHKGLLNTSRNMFPTRVGPNISLSPLRKRGLGNIFFSGFESNLKQGWPFVKCLNHRSLTQVRFLVLF